MGAFENEYRTYRSTYKFSDDGGLFADEYTMLEADQDMVVVEGYIHVKDAVLSAGAPTMIIGITGGDVNAFMTSKLKAALLTGTIFALDAAGLKLLLSKGDKISLDLGTANITAGELELVLVCVPVQGT